MSRRMITRARIYKSKNGQWIVDVSGEHALLSIMTEHMIRLHDGGSVARWFYGSWEEAHRSVFGPEKLAK